MSVSTVFLSYRSAPILESSTVTIAYREQNIMYHFPPYRWTFRTVQILAQFSGKVLSILCCCTALPTCTSYSTVTSHAMGPSSPIGYLAVRCCRPADELFERVQFVCVKTYNTAEILCLYRKAQRKLSSASTQNAVKRQHIRY